MKRIIILFTLVIIACSCKDLGGYTESIIKNIGTEKENAPIPKAEPIPEEEDLSSLDEEALREKLIDTYPWPKPKAEAEKAPSFFGLPHNPYTGEIKKFSWHKINSVFSPINNYDYGFDRDPTDKDPTVFISVETGEKSKTKEFAWFIPHLSKDAYDKYSLLHEKYNDNPAQVPSSGIKLVDGEEKSIKEGGTYTLWGCWLFCDGPNILQFWKNLEKKVTILPYEKKTKHIIYMQFDGKKGNTWDTAKDKYSFTEDRIKQKFNDVFKEAVVELDITPVEQTTQEIITVDMTRPNDKEWFRLKNIAENYFKNNKKGHPEYWHFVFAINKERKLWHLADCKYKMEDGTELLLLNSCNGFDPENEDKTTTYRMYSEKGCETSFGEDGPVEIKTITLEESGYRLYYIYKDGKPYSPSLCDILYTDNGYPIVPDDQIIKSGNAAAINYGINEDEFTLFEDYLAHASFAIVPRSKGESGLHTMIHEIGHAFGLTDVSQSSIIEQNETDASVDIDTSKNKAIYKNNHYATSETNLMTWIIPTGKKVRYRNTPIVCTGGTTYYVDVYNKETKTHEFGNIIGSIQREFPHDKSNKGYENQWECIRDCYKKEFATTERKNFFLANGFCENNSVPKGDNAKNILYKYEDKTNFEKIYRESLKGKIIE